MEIQMLVFSERIRELRKKRGLTQTQMAELLDCGSRHYQKIEHGEINIPSLMLKKLADHFGVSADYLLGRTDNPEVNR